MERDRWRSTAYIAYISIVCTRPKHDKLCSDHAEYGDSIAITCTQTAVRSKRQTSRFGSAWIYRLSQGADGVDHSKPSISQAHFGHAMDSVNKHALVIKVLDVVIRYLFSIMNTLVPVLELITDLLFLCRTFCSYSVTQSFTKTAYVSKSVHCDEVHELYISIRW